MPDVVPQENWVAYIVTIGIFDSAVFSDPNTSPETIKKIVDIEKEYVASFSEIVAAYANRWTDSETGAPILRPMMRLTQPKGRRDITYLPSAYGFDEAEKSRGFSIPRRIRLVAISFDNTRDVLEKFSTVLEKKHPISVTDAELRAGVPDAPAVIEWFFYDPEKPEDVPSWVYRPKENQ